MANYHGVEQLLPRAWSLREILSDGDGGCLHGLDAEVRIVRFDAASPRPFIEAEIDFGFDGAGRCREYVRRVSETPDGRAYLVKTGAVESGVMDFDPVPATRYLAIYSDGFNA